MLIEFQFGNFRSFRDIQKLSLEAAKRRPNDHGLEEDNVVEAGGFRLLKTKAVFGSNASGKTNVGRAIAASLAMVTRSVADENIPSQIWQDRFQLLTDWDDQPVSFQYVFTHDEAVWRYGFQILEDSVTLEWLFEETGERQIEYFTRNRQEVSINKSVFPPDSAFIAQALHRNNELFRKDSLFLTAAALNASILLASIRDNIRSIITIDGADNIRTARHTMERLVKGSDLEKEAIQNLLRAADTGIEELRIEDLSIDGFSQPKRKAALSPDRPVDNKPSVLLSVHARYDENGKPVERLAVPFELWESGGTKKFLGLTSLLLQALAHGSVLLIDEIDAGLHPNLTLKIVELFHNPQTNPHKAQLIFITHDASLLRRAALRRDQIALVNKNKFGISTLINLIEYKGVRKDASYDKEYLNGSYEGVPYLGEMDQAIINVLNDEGL